jgi:hypothetical protein
MNRAIYSVATAAFILTSCASNPSPPAAEVGNVEVIELTAAGNRTYAWAGKIYSIQELTAALVAQDQERPIQRVHLLDSKHPTTIADVIDVTILAKELGATSYMEKDGALQPVTFEIKD